MGSVLRQREAGGEEIYQDDFCHYFMFTMNQNKSVQ
jgi:hypothetical protein